MGELLARVAPLLDAPFLNFRVVGADPARATPPYDPSRTNMTEEEWKGYWEGRH